MQCKCICSVICSTVKTLCVRFSPTPSMLFPCRRLTNGFASLSSSKPVLIARNESSILLEDLTPATTTVLSSATVVLPTTPHMVSRTVEDKWFCGGCGLGNFAHCRKCIRCMTTKGGVALTVFGKVTHVNGNSFGFIALSDGGADVFFNSRNVKYESIKVALT